LILAGGFATRLRPLSCSRPKTLFPIVNKPLLEWIFEKLAKDGCEEAILGVNALTQFYIKQHHPHRHGLKVKFSVDPPRMPLGTAGPIKKAERLLGNDEPFIVLNGDIFADLSYRELYNAHVKADASATIALCKVEEPSRYGVAEMDTNNRIKRFIEKPPKGTAPSNLINAGVYILSPEVFDYIPSGKAVSMEREVFPKLAEERKLYGQFVNGLWIDIGKPEEYLQTNKMILDTLANAQKQKRSKNFELKHPVAFDKGVSIDEKSVIGPYAILGENVKIGKNVHISNSVVFPHASISDFSMVEGAIIGEGAHIGKHVTLSNGCIIGDHAKIKDNLHLSDASSVCPAKEVAENIIKPKLTNN
jgi:mannose-1-phosphate guanylyltransferase